MYGEFRAAGDLAVAGCPAHYILRSSWVIGDCHNVVRTMAGLSDRAADLPDVLSEVTVVDDRVGRLTFTDDMARAIFCLLGYRGGDLEPSVPAPYGTYDCTGSGEPASWAEIARAVFEARNGNGAAVRPVTTEEYYAGAEGPVAPRPAHSTLDLAKLEATGFHMPDWRESLGAYVAAMGHGL